MNDPRVPQCNYSNSSTWGGQQYSSSSNSFYQHDVHDADVRYHQTGYGEMESPQIDTPYERNDTTLPSYQHSNVVMDQPIAYNSISPGLSSMQDPQIPHHSGHYYPHTPPHHDIRSSYSQAPLQPQSPYPHARLRLNSQALADNRTRTVPLSTPQPSPYYPPQGISISPLYSVSSTRPFTCDLCALSFNRQHDLKRHRETHTGEKPYLCNGGCGKTFTRKDALKRHQVRQCLLWLSRVLIINLAGKTVRKGWRILALTNCVPDMWAMLEEIATFQLQWQPYGVH